MFWILKNLPPSFSKKMAILLVTVGFIWKKLIGSFGGLFFLSILSYAYCYFFGSFMPYSLEELLSWFSALDKDFKIAITSSFVTVLGFLIAFHAATINWKQQLRAQSKLIAAGEIEHIFSKIGDAVIQVKLFADGILEAVHVAQADPATQESQFKVSWELDKIKKFEVERDNLLRLTDEASKALQRYVNIFNGIPNGGMHIEKALDDVRKISGAAWVTLPYIDKSSSDFVADFVLQVKVEEYQKLKETIDRLGGPTVSLVYSTTALLKSDGSEFNIHSLAAFYSKSSNFEEYFEKVFYRK